MCFIKIENLSFNYNSTNIFNNLNLLINKLDFVSLIGPSGSGKSTLLKIIAKILTNYAGNIFVENTNLKNYKPNFGYMPQNHLLLPWKTVLENLLIPLIINGKKTTDAKNTVCNLLEEFSLANIINNYPNELSGGQKQRVSLLRSILINSNLLLLDEPFSQLDAFTKINIQKFLYSVYLKYKYTILLVTHDIDEAILLSNKIYVVNRDGAIKKCFIIDLPANRTEKTIIEDDFLNYKKKITSFILEIS